MRNLADTSIPSSRFPSRINTRITCKLQNFI